MTRTDKELAEAARAFENFDPAAAVRVDVSDLRAIAELADSASRNEALLTERVAIARAHGRSWARIGIALGVSRQAARQRFARKVDA